MNEYVHIVKQADATDQIKQTTDERTIKQYTYIKSEQADDGTRRQIRQTGKNQRQT